MGNLTGQNSVELKQLPLILCKLLGGLATVIGFTSAIWILTRTAETSTGDVFPQLFAAAVGIVVFLLSDRRLKRQPPSITEKAGSDVKSRQNLWPWALLLLFAGAFVLATYLLTLI